MAATPSIKVLKTFGYKGGNRVWSNRYHFNGGTPADATHWHTLMDAVTAAEKATFNDSCTITGAIGYAAGSDVPVAEKVYDIPGTLTAGGSDIAQAGDVAALVRYTTAARTTKNHPIYLFNYVHSVFTVSNDIDVDKLSTDQRTALQTYATAWVTGFSDGTITALRASPNGAVATGSDVEQYVTHRDFPYQSSV